MATSGAFDCLGTWAAPNNTPADIKIGHVQLPIQGFSSYLHFLRIEKSIRKSEEGPVVIHIGSNLEQEHAATASFRLWTWEEFIRIVKKNKDLDTHGLAGYRDVSQPFGWIHHQILSPLAIKGISYLHIVPSATHYQHCTYDLQTNQVARMETLVSRAEFMEQLSWARSSTCSSSQVYIYTDGIDLEKPPVTLFQERRSLHIENEQMGGFITAVCGLTNWGVDPRVVLPMFLSESESLERMTRLLCTQDILSLTPFCLGLSEAQSSAFLAMLPMVKYDYRVAYFATLPSPDGIVIRVKAQLAALLTEGLGTVRLFEEGLGSMEEFEKACWGYGWSLAGTGTMWAKLGIWKRAAEYHGMSWELNTEPKELWIRNAGLVNRVSAIRIEKLASRLLITLHEHGISPALGASMRKGKRKIWTKTSVLFSKSICSRLIPTSLPRSKSRRIINVRSSG